MARYRITEEPSGVSIEVTDVGDHVDELMDAFAECQAGQCSCPTDEYRKLASLQVVPTHDRVTLTLEPKPGESFDTAEIGRCLDHTTAKTKDVPPRS